MNTEKQSMLYAMTQKPDLKHITHGHRKYRIADDGTVYVWRTLDDSFQLAWRKVTDPQLIETIKQLVKP